MIGIATKAGKTLSGEFSTEKAIKTGKAKLVIVAKDASDNTKKSFMDMCVYRDIPIFFHGNKILLGQATGNEFRASLAVIDTGLAQSIMKHLNTTI